MIIVLETRTQKSNDYWAQEKRVDGWMDGCIKACHYLNNSYFVIQVSTIIRKEIYSTTHAQQHAASLTVNRGDLAILVLFCNYLGGKLTIQTLTQRNPLRRRFWPNDRKPIYRTRAHTPAYYSIDPTKCPCFSPLASEARANIYFHTEPSCVLTSTHLIFDSQGLNPILPLASIRQTGRVTKNRHRHVWNFHCFISGGKKENESGGDAHEAAAVMKGLSDANISITPPSLLPYPWF